VNNFDLFVDLIKALPKTDIRLGYTFSDSDNGFTYGGPRIGALQNNSILTVGGTMFQYWALKCRRTDWIRKLPARVMPPGAASLPPAVRATGWKTPSAPAR
jgi:hypothetical protein